MQPGIGDVAEDVVRRQKSRIVGFGEGEDAFVLNRHFEATLQRWMIAFGLTVALTPVLWWCPVLTLILGFGLYLFRLAENSRRLGVLAAVVGVGFLTLASPVPVLHRLPLPVAALAALAVAWAVSKPLSRLVDHDRPFSYWVAVFTAEADAPRITREDA